MLVDANLLLYARDATSRFHPSASRWLEQSLNGPNRVGLPWESLSAFLRIATHPRAVVDPLRPAVAWAQVETWLQAPAAWVPQPTDRHAEVYGRLIGEGEISGNLVPDAHLAAIAICHGIEVYTADSDFARFADLRWENPL